MLAAFDSDRNAEALESRQGHAEPLESRQGHAEPLEAPPSAVPPPLAKNTFIDRVFAERQTYLERDRFAGIGECDTFRTKIMGVSFEGRQDMVAGLLPGMELELRRQPHNVYDENALAVHYGAFQIGFLRKEIAKQLAPLIDAGARYSAHIEHVTGGSGGKNFGLNVTVRRELDVAKSNRRATIAPGSEVDRAAIQSALIGSAPPHEAQLDVLSRFEAGKNTLAVLGTGRGKSFCFQYPAAYRALESSQKTLAIYPLRALANDQYDAMERRLGPLGLRIFRANGSISAGERAGLMQALQEGSWDIIVATPEFLQFHREAFTAYSKPDVVVVDEAHHLFESKHRPAYGKLGQTLASLGKPQVLALTATAADAAFECIVDSLAIEAWVVDPTIRENLRLIDARGTADKIAYLSNVLDDGGKAIVYCNSRSEATKVAQELRKRFGNDVLFYHAGMPSSERSQVETYFRSGLLRIVVATSAFGEGIDLPDVRHVVIYHLNFDFTEFNQQAGRAGRDGEPAHVHLLFGERDRRLNEFLIDRDSPTLPTLRAIYRGLRGLAAGNTIRMPYDEIARTLDLGKAQDRAIAVAVAVFEDEGLAETGIDEGGRYLRLRPVDGKVDLTKNERFAEGEAAREQFARFCELVLTAAPASLERIVNRPIYPERTQLRR